MNLELSDTVDLIQELAKRFENIIILGMKAASNETSGEHAVNPFVWKYKGGALQALGMCNVAEAFIREDIGMKELTKDDI